MFSGAPMAVYRHEPLYRRQHLHQSGNSFIGSFFGNGLVGWIVVSGTSTQAMSDAGYLLISTQLTTVTLPPSPNVDDIVRISGAGAGGWKVAQNAGQAILGNFSGFTSSSWTVSGASTLSGMTLLVIGRYQNGGGDRRSAAAFTPRRIPENVGRNQCNCPLLARRRLVGGRQQTGGGGERHSFTPPPIPAARGCNERPV